MAARIRTLPFALQLLLCAVLISVPLPAHASGPDETIPSAATLVELERRADTASVREKCALYTELVHRLTELAGQQIGTGDEEAAAVTLRRIDLLALKVHAAEVKDAKHLEDAEMLMEHTTHRLNDMLHLANGEQHTALKATLDHLNAVHIEMLALVFAQ